APARDVLHVLRFELVMREILRPRREVTHAIVEQPRHHRLLRQLHHAVMKHHRRRLPAHRPATETAAAASGRSTTAPARAVRVSLLDSGLQVVAEGPIVLNERPRRIHASRAHVLPRAPLWDFATTAARAAGSAASTSHGHEQPGHIHYRV